MDSIYIVKLYYKGINSTIKLFFIKLIFRNLIHLGIKICIQHSKITTSIQSND